jgi:anthranilate phosphoribosyltransferase
VPLDGCREAVVIDTCGTGGAGKTFNISTAAAIVTAAGSPHHAGGGVRVVVAKHGNRSRSGRGSAEVLAKLGVNVDAPPAVQARCLTRAGVCFCFAIHHHPATRHATPARRSLGFPTLFNLLGPLTNPAGARRQLIGVYDAAFVERLAHTLARLGAERAMVVHGRDGMDELTTTGPSLVATVEDGRVTVGEFDPAALGVPRASAEQLTALDLDAAAATVRGVVSGARGPARDIVILNAGAALFVAGAAGTIMHGSEMAAAAIDSGRAARTLADLAGASAEP